MIAIKYRVVGLKKLQAALTAAPGLVASENAWALNASVSQVEANYKALMPLGPGHFGFHARDRVFHRLELRRARAVGLVGTDASQAVWREFGTEMHRIPKTGFKPLRIGDNVRAWAWHPGEKKFRTMRTALKIAKPAIRAFFALSTNHLTKSLATSGD